MRTICIGKSADQMVSAAVEEMYRVDDDNRFLGEVTGANGDKEGCTSKILRLEQWLKTSFVERRSQQ